MKINQKRTRRQDRNQNSEPLAHGLRQVVGETPAETPRPWTRVPQQTVPPSRERSSGEGVEAGVSGGEAQGAEGAQPPVSGVWGQSPLPSTGSEYDPVHCAKSLGSRSDSEDLPPDSGALDGGGGNTPAATKGGGCIAPKGHLGARIDYWTLAFRCRRSDLDRFVEAAHRALDEEAASYGEKVRPIRLAAPLDLGPAGHWQVTRNGDLSLHLKSGMGIQAHINLGDSVAGWHIEVVLQGTYFLTSQPAMGLELAKALAEELTRPKKKRLVPGEPPPPGRYETGENIRSRRLDLATDVRADFDLDDTKAVVKPRRAQVKLHPISKHGGEGSYYRSGDRMSGCYVGKVNSPLRLSLYDKTLQLEQKSEELQKAEKDGWVKHGWDGKSTVWRCEFRLRGDALHEFKLRDGDPKRVLDSLDTLWKYCTDAWVRLVDPESDTRLYRCKLDERWKLIQYAGFGGAKPVSRKRIRTGMDAAHMQGAIVSFLGRAGKLPQLADVALTTVGEVLLSHKAVRELDDEEVKEHLNNWVTVMLEAVGPELVEQLTCRFALKLAEADGQGDHVKPLHLAKTQWSSDEHKGYREIREVYGADARRNALVHLLRKVNLNHIRWQERQGEEMERVFFAEANSSAA